MFWIATASILLSAAAFVVFRDRTQRDHAVLRNFPLVGHFRYLMEGVGDFLRQYWFTADWEERPFDRLTRAWVYRSAKKQANGISFGSELDQSQPGHIRFLHSAFPTNETDAKAWEGPLIGEGRCPNPWRPKSFLNISAMSYGALSSAAVQALSAGAKKAGMWLDTGEGGLSEHHLSGGCDVVFEIGTAKYSVRDGEGGLDESRLAEISRIENVRMFEVKLSQGAKPGKGGILPGAKVTEEVSRIRGIPFGKDSISPNRHTEIVDPASLSAFVARVRRITGKPTGVKFSLGDPSFLEDWFSHVAEDPDARCPDFIQIDGAEGGTGSAPAPLADHVGLPVVEALPLLVDALERHGLRKKVAVVASGKLTTPDKAAWALCMGADIVVGARGFMFSLGCIQSMKCGSGRCPTGVATNDPRFMKGLDPTLKSERVAAYAEAMRRDVEIISHSCGCESPRGLRRRHVGIVGGGGFGRSKR